MSTDLVISAPLYVQIKERIAQQYIEANAEWLPTEVQLAQQFGVSRVTIRKAIEEFKREGRVIPVQGQGTRVVRQKKLANILVVCNSYLEAYHHDLIDGLMEILPRHGINFSLVKIGDDPRSVEHVRASAANFDGILRCGYVVTHNPGEIELEDILADAVYLHPCGVTYIPPAVVVNRKQGFRLLSKHLLDLGHRKIAYIGHFGPDRAEVIAATLAERGLTLPDEMRVETLQYREKGYAAAKELLRRSRDFTAVVCGNDVTAHGAMQYFMQQGIRIPEDVSLTGYDNLRESASYPVPLTTAGASLETLITKALEMLREKKREIVTVDVTLEQRASTAGARE